MRVRRYNIVQAVLTPEGEIIPIWDERISYNKTQEYGHLIKVNGDHMSYSMFVEVIYDIKKRKLSSGIPIDIYPTKGLEFEKGEAVYLEAKGNAMKEVTVEDILFETYDMDIVRGNKLVGRVSLKEKEKYPELNKIDPDLIYALKRWKPSYLLSDGTKTEYEYKLKHRV